MARIVCLLDAINTVNIVRVLTSGVYHPENGFNYALLLNIMGLALLVLVGHEVVVAGVGVEIMHYWVKALCIWIQRAFFKLIVHIL